MVRKKEDWKGLSGTGVVESKVERHEKISSERRFYITTLTNVDKFAKGARKHWGIENGLHHVLDVAFNEDKITQRKGESPANSEVLRHIALNLIKSEKSKKVSVNRKRALACLIPNYLERIIFGEN